MTQALLIYIECAWLAGIGFLTTFAGPYTQDMMANDATYRWAPRWLVDATMAVLITLWPISALIYILHRWETNRGR